MSGAHTGGERRLIVCADDFGLSAGVNAGIMRAHRDGILTDASLMVNGAAFPEAVELARSTPTLSVGLHLVLVQGHATSAASDLPQLVDAGGMFGHSAVGAGLRYFFTPGIRQQLEREICAQLEKYRRTGLALSHVDGHLNIHMHPTVLGILVKRASRYGIRAVRLPREPVTVSLRLDGRQALRKVVESVTFKGLIAYAQPRLETAGIRHPDQMFGLHQSGHVTEHYLRGVIAALPAGVTEVYSHAAVVDDEARRWRPDDYESAAELAALTSPRVRAALAARNIERISYRQLARSI
ncbi:MAG: hopanoid biosynthesis-associated protein HpnK [Candidatus Binatia bacterium]